MVNIELFWQINNIRVKHPLFCYKLKKPSFWVRDKPQASAEVDLVMQYQDKLIPIEIKFGSTGSLKALHQFINRADHDCAVRIYGGEFSTQEQKTPEGKSYKLINLPYYLGVKLEEYIAFFLDLR